MDLVLLLVRCRATADVHLLHSSVRFLPHTWITTTSITDLSVQSRFPPHTETITPTIKAWVLRAFHFPLCFPSMHCSQELHVVKTINPMKSIWKGGQLGYRVILSSKILLSTLLSGQGDLLEKSSMWLPRSEPHLTSPNQRRHDGWSSSKMRGYTRWRYSVCRQATRQSIHDNNNCKLHYWRGKTSGYNFCHEPAPSVQIEVHKVVQIHNWVLNDIQFKQPLSFPESQFFLPDNLQQMFMVGTRKWRECVETDQTQYTIM